MYRKVLLVFSALFYTGIALQLPPGIKTCKRSDKDFENCLKDAIQDTLPKLQTDFSEFNLPSVQPLHIPSLTIDQGKGVVHVVQKYKHFNIYDIIKAKIQRVEAKATLGMLELTAEAFLPEIRIEAEYELDGHVLMVPIKGNGTCTLVLKNVNARVDSFSEVSDSGYLEMKFFSLELRPESMSLEFRNLFGGNVLLGDVMNRLLNASWGLIWEDIRFGYQRAIANEMKDLGNIIFSQVLYEELFPQ